MDHPTSPVAPSSDFANQLSAALPPPPQRNIVFFNNRGLRAGWRILIYILLVFSVGAVISGVARKIHPPTHSQGFPTPRQIILQEALSFALVFGGAFLMSKIEKRPLGAYGLPGASAFGKNFWLGMFLGLAEVSLLIALIAAFGGYSFGNLALAPAGILRWGLIHLLLFTLVGFFEEFAFRGYLQYTLADGIGFWPAGVLLSLLFGAVHLGNPGEGWVGAISVVLIGLLFVFTIYRSGNLWFAVGLHASFDWGETFLYSVPNSGTVMDGHLSNALLHGPKWLTGGSVGPEGSVFCFLTMALQFLVVLWLFPKRPANAGAPVAVEVAA